MYISHFHDHTTGGIHSEEMVSGTDGFTFSIPAQDTTGDSEITKVML